MARPRDFKVLVATDGSAHGRAAVGAAVAFPWPASPTYARRPGREPRVGSTAASRELPAEYQYAWGSKTYYSQVVATVSNWGAYGVEVALSAVLGARDALHDLTIEHRMLEACSRAGGVDGRYQTPD